MNEVSKKEIKLNGYGEVDVEYYIAMAHNQRSEYFSQSAAKMKSWISEFFKTNELKFTLERWAHR